MTRTRVRRSSTARLKEIIVRMARKAFENPHGDTPVILFDEENETNYEVEVINVEQSALQFTIRVTDSHVMPRYFTVKVSEPV